MVAEFSSGQIWVLNHLVGYRWACDWLLGLSPLMAEIREPRVLTLQGLDAVFRISPMREPPGSSSRRHSSLEGWSPRKGVFRQYFVT